MKFLIVGDTGVGKTTLALSFAKASPPTAFELPVPGPTVGIRHNPVYTTVNGKKTKLTFWDASGQAKYHSLIGTFAGASDAVLFVFNSLESLHSLDSHWIPFVNANLSSPTTAVFYLLPNQPAGAPLQPQLHQQALELTHKHAVGRLVLLDSVNVASDVQCGALTQHLLTDLLAKKAVGPQPALPTAPGQDIEDLVGESKRALQQGKTVIGLCSACLLGIKCKYDGGDNLTPPLKTLASYHALTTPTAAGQVVLVPFCPEQLGGLPTPRKSSSIEGLAFTGFDVLDGKAKVFDVEGLDVTANFLRGAEESLSIAQASGARFAILKQYSPSCASHTTRDGVASALLQRNGLKVFSELDKAVCAIADLQPAGELGKQQICQQHWNGERQGQENLWIQPGLDGLPSDDWDLSLLL